MTPITLQGIITEDHRLVIDLPDHVSPGPVKVVIEPQEQKKELSNTSSDSLTLEKARELLRAGGALFEGKLAPDDAEELSPEEEEQLGRLFSGSRSTLDYINEDREERF